MGSHSRNKGKRGEREWSKMLNQMFPGLNARRGQQRSGLDRADVIDGIPGTHCEVKRVERLRVYAAMKQAANDAATGTIPYTATRSNNQEWLVILRATDLKPFCQCVISILGVMP